MKKWKEIPKTERWMMVIIVLLVIAIITRWGYVKEELSGAFSNFGRTEQRTPVE